MKASQAHPKNGAGRRRDAARTRDALIAAGTGLFAERGYDGVPVATIAAKAKVNKAMISYHFGGKWNLYVAIVSATFSEIVSRVEALADSSRLAPDLLRDLVAVVGDTATRRSPHFCTMMLREVLSGGKHLELAVLAMPARVLGAVQRIVERGVRRQPGVLLRDGRLPGARAREPTVARAQASHARGLRQSPPGDDHARARHRRGGWAYAESEAPGARAPRSEGSPRMTASESAASSIAAAPARRRRRPIVLAGALLVLGLGAIAGWRVFLAGPAVPAGVIALSGRIEGDDASVGAKTSGRIREITVREGDQVTAGQIIAVLDDAQVRAREQQSEAAVRQAEARLRVSQHQIIVLNEQLRQSELGVDQSRADAQGRVDEAEARLATAEAQLAQAEASYTQAKWECDAFTRLAEMGLVAVMEAKLKESAEQGQAAVVTAAKRQVEAARGAITTARANFANPAIRSSQVAAVQGQILQAQADIAALQADAERARAQLEEARANRSDLTVIAPFAGTVATRTAEPGEVVMAGTPIVTLVNLGQVYLRAFVTEGEIGRVRVGQPARVYLDSPVTTPIGDEAEAGAGLRADRRAARSPAG